MDKQEDCNETVEGVMRIKVDNNTFGYIIELLYSSDEAKKYHNTATWDKFIKGRLRKKLEEMIECNDHRPCKVLTSLMAGEIDE